MKLVGPLIAGIRGAENGTVSFLIRGTATAANYYADFEATQLLPGTGVLLDSYGALEAYVAQLVTVRVYDSLGVIVREFVAGDYDATVEVISPSFTGVDYTSGASGTQKPTNLENVLDAWIASAGAPDFKVLSGGVATNLSAVLATTFFNVKAYGAQGNGVTGDGTAITSAIAAATAAGGGTVFFPPGVYRIAAVGINLPGNINLLGSGGMSSKLAIDSGIGGGAIILQNNAVGALSNVNGLWIGALNGATPGALIQAPGAVGEFHFTDCVFGNDALTNSYIYNNAASGSSFKIVFTRCYSRVSTGGQSMFRHLGTGRFIMRDCEVVSAQTAGNTLIFCERNGLIEGNRFDYSAATAGTVRYVAIAPTSSGGVVIVGNYFVGCPTVGGPVGIYNSLSSATDCLEYGNTFGDSLAPHTPSLTPYAYAVDGYAALTDNMLTTGGHQTRLARTEIYTPVAGSPLSVDPKAFATTVVNSTVGALTVNANAGSMGDKWTLEVYSLAGVTVTPGTNIVFDPAVAGGTLVVPAASRVFAQLAWLPTGGGTGLWYTIGKAVIT